MKSSANETREARATHIEVSKDTLSVELADGRTVSAPLAWYPRLAHATNEERNLWRLIGGGHGIHWPAVDEDISVDNLLAGHPSAESVRLKSGWPVESSPADAGNGKRPKLCSVDLADEFKAPTGPTPIRWIDVAI